MDLQTIRAALGQLQHDADNADAWTALRKAVQARDENTEGELHQLLAGARGAHAERHEWHAVAQLLGIELSLPGDNATLLSLWSEYATVLSQHLLNEEEAIRAQQRILELEPGNAAARAALAESDERRSRWEQLAVNYLGEANRAPDNVYKSSMLMRVAEMELRYGDDGVDPEIIETRLTEACALDPNNQIAAEMLENIWRRSADWLTLANLLEGLLGRVTSSKIKIVYGLKLARLYRNQLEDPEQAAEAFKKVLAIAPNHSEAATYLSEFYSAREAWSDLVTLHVQRLSVEDQRDLSRLGEMLQIAMLYYRKLNQPELAEPWFERVRRLEPANAVTLEFFREYLGDSAGEARLLTILQAAARAVSEGPEKQTIGRQIAVLTERHQGARKAIEQYKGLLRQDPNNGEVREELKELYRKTGGYTALVELLRQQLEHTPTSDSAIRLALLREVAELYRNSIPSETALASVLSQIVAIDTGDAAAVRELIELYEKLGRFRELLSYQQRLAEISDDRFEKIRVLRAAGRRWLEQFSNVQNATQAYEALLALEPEDGEAREQLKELYKKRRAWQPLLELYASEAEQKTGAEKSQVMLEMAQLCADRLGRADQAIKLYLQILELDPKSSDVIDALERQAERTKDWPTLAKVLERRVDVTSQPLEQIAVLGKLGAIYSDHLNDSGGATRAWTRVLELQPGHQRALRVLRDIYLAGGDFDGLEGLYGAHQDYEGLAEVLGNAAEKATSPKERVDLSYRAARVYREHLAAPERAFRSYERILATQPNDAEAARMLLPIYEREEKWGRIPALYEILIEATDDVREKLELLKKAIHVAGHKLGDRAGSVAYARRAYEILPDEPESLDLFEATAASAGHWQSVVDAIEARITELSAAEPTPEGTGKGRRRKAAAQPARLVGRELRLKLAQVQDERLQRTDSAVALLKALVEHAPSDEEAGSRLEAILRRENRRDDLRWLLNLRAEHAASEETKVELLYQWASLETDVFLDPIKAIELFRRVLEISADHLASLRRLAELLLASGEHAAAAKVLEEQIKQVTGEEQANAYAELGQIYLDHLARPADAFEAATRVLALLQHDSRAIALLERLAQAGELRERAAEVLAIEYAEMGDARHEVEALQTMLSAATLPEDRYELFQRLASVQERKLDSINSAFDTTLKAAREFPTRIELWDQAEKLATRSGRPTDLALALRETLSALAGSEIEIELCERAALLYQDKLGDPAGAIPYLERIIKREPGNERAFQQLKEVLTAQQRWGELAELYELVSGALDDPQAQVEMFAEVALVCEEITEDSANAIKYYERILSIDPYHEATLQALDRLYAKHERYENLAALLELRVERSVGDDRLDQKNRLAYLLLDKLHRPAEAIRHLEDVLTERIGDYEARQLTERVLEIGSLRERAARILENVYEVRNEVRELVGVLEIQLDATKEALVGAAEAAGGNEQYRELLRRIANLKSSRLHDDEGAFRALAEYVPLDPSDVDARELIQTIGERLGAFEKLAQVLATAAAASDGAAQRAELLFLTAKIRDQRLNDLESSPGLYRQVLELEQDAPDLAIQAAYALEQVYARTGQKEELAEALRTQIRLSSSEAERSNLQGRLANLLEVVLADADGAIEVWNARIELNPVDLEALLALVRLYDANQRWRELVQVLKQRQDQSEDAEERKALQVRAANVLAEKLGDLEGAISVWRNVSDEFVADPVAIQALEDLYRRAERWDDLADTYQSHLQFTEATSERLALWVSLGDLRRGQLGNAATALEAYREALTLDPTFAPSRRALEKLLTDEEVLVRHEAAQTLRKIYEAEHDAPHLLQVLEIEAATSDDLTSKLELLRTASRVAEHDLSDVNRALDYVKQAVGIARAHGDLGLWLEELERLSKAPEQRAEQVSLLGKIVDDIFDGQMKYDVTLRIAKLGRDELNDLEIAREYFEKALELEPEGSEPLAALDALYENSGKARDLLRILDRRIEIAGDVQERKGLMFRRAKLFVSDLQDRARAIEAYEAIVDLDLDTSAIEQLEVLYIGEGRFAALIALYERELDNDPGHAADYRVKIAKILTDQFDDKARAFDELEAAIAADGQHAGAISELQRFLGGEIDSEYRARAAELLEPIYLARADYDKVMKAISGRLEGSDDPVLRRELLLRLAKLYEEQKEDYAAALETMARLFHEDIGSEAIVLELERLAKVADAEQRLAEIYAAELPVKIGDVSQARLAQRAGELFVRFKENERALRFYRSALDFEPDNRKLFTAVDFLLQIFERHQERVALYSNTLDYRYEPAERAQLLHTIAELQRIRLSQKEQAIETYTQILDIDEGDQKALDALTDLYRDAERYDDLAALYLRRAEATASPEVAAEYRIELSRLYRNQLQDTGRAIEQLEEVTRSIPTHQLALSELEALRGDEKYRERIIEILRPLYEAGASWRQLIALDEDRLALARELAERISILTETAKLWEERGDDPEQARQALGRALELDPDNGAVRAEYERLTRRVQAWADLVAFYEMLLELDAVGADKREYIASLAQVYDKELNDPRQAINAYTRLLEIDPTDLEVVQKLEQLAMLLSDWQTLVKVLEAKVELLLSDVERASVWRQIGEGKRDMLDDPAGAILAYEQAFALEPDLAFTVDCLIGLYEQAKKPQRLVELYEERVALTPAEETEDRYALWVAAAHVYETELGDRTNAIEKLNHALSEKPNDVSVLTHLAKLYRTGELWVELLENLERRAAVSTDDEQRVQLQKEIAEILANRLDNFEQALAMYKVVLDARPSDEDAIAAALQIAREHESLRGVAGRVLVPVLSNARQYQRLVEVLELRLTVETDPSIRLQTLREIAGHKEVEFNDLDAALDALLLALSEGPEAAGLHEEIERLAARAKGWGRYATALEERASATFDADLAKDLFVRLGRVAEDQLGDIERAVTAYARAIEQVGDQADLLATIDRLYEKQGNQAALSEIIERRLAFASSVQEQAGLYFRLACLQEDALKEPEQALASLKVALELDPQSEATLARLEKLSEDSAFFEEAIGALEEAYRFGRHTERLAALYQKRIDFAESAEQRIELRRSLARIFEEESGDAAAAQRVLSQGLKDAPSDAALLDEIERLAAKTNDFSGAASAIEQSIAANPSLSPEAARSLCIRGAEWYREQVGDPASAERILRKALEIDPNSDDVLYQIEKLERTAGQSRPLIETLRRRGKLQLDPNLREDLYRQAIELAEVDQDGATVESLLRELLAQDDSNLLALARLTEICEQSENYREELDLLQRRIELRADGGALVELRHKAAEIADQKLGQTDRAIEIYLQLFDDDPNDTRARDALRQLYVAGEQWQELRRLVERLIDLAELPEERSTLRLELAELSQERLGETESAIDLLQNILYEEPTHGEAVVRLSRIYEKNGWDKPLAELLDQQIEAAHERGDLSAELTFRARLGEIYEQRLGDRAKAIEVFEGVLEQEPQHRMALATLARLYRAEQKPFELAGYLERLLALSDAQESVGLIAELSETYQTLGDIEQEITVLEKGLPLDPGNRSLRERLHQIYEERGDWDKLVGLIAGEAAHTDNVEEKVRLLRLASAVHSEYRGDPASAVEFLAAASKLKPEDRALMLELCDAYSASGRNSDAIGVLERIVESFGGKRSKELSDIHRRLAKAYKSEDKIEAALVELDKALRIEPGNVSVLKEIGSAALEVGDLKKAQQMYRALLLQKFDNDSPISKAEVFLDLAVVHERLGETQKAIQMAERAVQSDGLLEAAHGLLEKLKGS